MQPLLTSAGLSLAGIMAALFAAAWLVQRLRNHSLAKNPTTSPIQIIATRALGPNAALLIIEAHNHRFLVSSHRGALTTIGRLGDEDESK